MKHTYFIYKNPQSGELIVSAKSIPFKKKYVGIKAKIEAIKRFTGENLPSTISGDEIKKFVHDKFYGKPLMKEYRNVLEQVKEEVEEINNIRVFIQTLQVSFQSDIDPNDPTLINVIHKYLENENIDIYTVSNGVILAINKL